MVIGIIEDDTLLRKALDISLKNQGYTTILAGSRKEAIKNIDSSVDLLIVDIGLPDGDGINLYQELQKNRKIPAIFLTAKDDEKDMLKAFDTGADDYVVKPLRTSEEQLCFLVESFIKTARLEQGIIQVHTQKENLVETILNALGQIQKKAEEKDIYFQVELPEKIICEHDKNWMCEALYNVFDNAVKYSKSNSTINITMKQTEMFYKIQIRDYGIGIRDGEENKIFQRFYRGEQARGQEGCGIGLYLSREIVLLQKGMMKAKQMKPGLLIEVNLPV